MELSVWILASVKRCRLCGSVYRGKPLNSLIRSLLSLTICHDFCKVNIGTLVNIVRKSHRHPHRGRAEVGFLFGKVLCKDEHHLSYSVQKIILALTFSSKIFSIHHFCTHTSNCNVRSFPSMVILEPNMITCLCIALLLNRHCPWFLHLQCVLPASCGVRRRWCCSGSSGTCPPTQRGCWSARTTRSPCALSSSGPPTFVNCRVISFTDSDQWLMIFATC